MRKKIEELRNREEGFTLVELLAVIVILGIIVAIAIPAIGGVTNRARSQATTAEKELVIDAAQLYAVENNLQGETTVTVETLVDNGFLEELDANSNIKETNGVKITVGDPVDSDAGLPTYKYEFVEAATQGAT